MAAYIVLFNPNAGNFTGESSAYALKEKFPNDSLDFVDMTGIKSYTEFFAQIGNDTTIILSGGDGTINRFINDTEGIDIPNNIYYYATGSGNDFLHDLGKEKGAEPIDIKKYLVDLPVVEVNGKKYKFLNGIGYGIDGYCCEVGDALRGTTDKPINYASIAIKGVLFHFHPANAVITVDGKEYEYKKVWLAPTMNGRFYGGGMMAAPGQDRLNSDRTVSLVVWHKSGKLATLMAFSSIFTGEHIKHEKTISVFTGHNISVRFDRPIALQIDGETIPGVTEYTVTASEPAKNNG